MKGKFLILMAAGLIVLSCQSVREEHREENFSRAMVVCAHPVAAETGLNILKNGGNAVDAVVATELALMVTFPEAGNIGGGGFMLIRDSAGSVFALDFREKAPAAAKTDMFLDKSGQVVKGLSINGHLAAGVPGTIDGLKAAHDRFGRLPWSSVVQPAIDLARAGVPLTVRAANNLNRIQEDLATYNTLLPKYLMKVWKPGDRVQWSDLSRTLELIRDNGRAGFYEGPTAEAIVSEMKRGNGLITLEDLQKYRSRWLEPVYGNYRGYKIYSMPPPSSGGIALLQLLASMEPYDIRSMGHQTTATLHLMTEAERRVYADRAEYLGDPDFYPVPVKKLINPQYNRDRMSNFNPGQATPSHAIKAGTLPDDGTETTHISIVDAAGNAVALTTTLNEWFGNKVVVGGAGFFLNDEMDDFSAKPGVPNMFGLLGGEANKIEPGKTMLSAMTPTIVEQKDGRLFMVLGSPGGSTIITNVFQVLLNVIDHGMTMQEAVNARRVHSQWYPDLIAPEENALDSQVARNLRALGHTLKYRKTFGRVDAILVLPDGRLQSGADSTRGDDRAAGY